MIYNQEMIDNESINNSKITNLKENRDKIKEELRNKEFVIEQISKQYPLHTKECDIFYNQIDQDVKNDT